MKKVIIFVMVLSLFFINSVKADILEEGTCGSGCYYNILSDNSLIIACYNEIGGTPNINVSTNGAPWNSFDAPLTLFFDESCTQKGMNDIGIQAFYKSSLTGWVELPNSIKSIQVSAFYQCGLSDIYIPQNVRYIGPSAFYGIKNVYFEADSPNENWDKEALNGVENIIYGCTVSEFKTCMQNGHDLSASYTIDKDSTCTELGEQSVHCSVCGGHFWKKEVPLKDHTPVSFEKEDATCTKSGHEAGTKCLKCGKILTGNEYIRMLDHDYIFSKTLRAETPYDPGESEYICSVCGKSNIQEIKQLQIPMPKKISITKKKNKCTVKVKKQILQNEFVELKYSTKSNMKWYKKKKLNGSKLTLTKKKKLFIRVRTGVTSSVNKIFYSDWSKKYTVK